MDSSNTVPSWLSNRPLIADYPKGESDPNKTTKSFWSRFSFAHRSTSESAKARTERDLARGYSINVKQVVLAFAIELFIIGIGLTGWYLLAPEAMLWPLALAVVELARVPLAIAVRIQKSWNIQFAALLRLV